MAKQRTAKWDLDLNQLLASWTHLDDDSNFTIDCTWISYYRSGMMVYASIASTQVLLGWARGRKTKHRTDLAERRVFHIPYRDDGDAREFVRAVRSGEVVKACVIMGLGPGKRRLQYTTRSLAGSVEKEIDLPSLPSADHRDFRRQSDLLAWLRVLIPSNMTGPTYPSVRGAVSAMRSMRVGGASKVCLYQFGGDGSTRHYSVYVGDAPMIVLASTMSEQIEEQRELLKNSFFGELLRKE